MATLNDIKALIVASLRDDYVGELGANPEWVEARDLGGSIIALETTTSTGKPTGSFDIHIIQRG